MLERRTVSRSGLDGFGVKKVVTPSWPALSHSPRRPGHNGRDFCYDFNMLAGMKRTDAGEDRGFWALFVTQFQGAFSDNVLKNLVIFMIIGMGVSLGEKHRIGELVGALFALPFILFSMAAGHLADRYSKRSVTVAIKIFELGVMSLASLGLLWHSLPLLLGCVFLMGTHSAFFGPSKYGLLPELLPERRLSWGNGVLELGTYMAIILGTVAAGEFSEHLHGHLVWVGWLLLALAAIGWWTSLRITKVPASDPARVFRPNFLANLGRSLLSMRGDRPLALAVVGNTYFSFIGALLLLNLFFYGWQVLRVSDSHISLLSLALAVGIGLGSVAAGYLSGGKIEYGLVPLGACGLSAGCLALAWPGFGLAGALGCLAFLGFAGGFFIVPVSALLQHRPEPSRKGEVLAAANLLSFVGVFLASGAHWLLTQVFALSPCGVFLLSALITLAGAAYAILLLPEALLRFGFWCATRTLYRLRVEGREYIPAKGGALFVCNHLSLIDGLLLLAATDREVRFIMDKSFYELPWIRPFARLLRAIPISSELRPRELLGALHTAAEAIKAGHVVCIFAEGQITRTGLLLPFRRGFAVIMESAPAPIIPVALDGIWATLFTLEHGRPWWKLPRRLPQPATLCFGAPMPATSTPLEVRSRVQELLAEAWGYRRPRIRPLQGCLLRTARRHPRRFAMADAQTRKLSFGSALVRSLFLAGRLRAAWQGQSMVGLLLPPSVPGALANFAALFAGRVPVNLNYTVSAPVLASCCRQCGLTSVLTSRLVLEKLKLTLPAEVSVLLLEDLAAAPRWTERLVALARAFLLPTAFVSRSLGQARRTTLDDVATVIFSSGSTGAPKGVLLSHYNVGSNIEQLEQVFGLDRSDRVLGILPFFHSFGFTATLCLPAVLGAGVAYHTNPLDTKAIAPLVSDYSLTFMLATPTFLQFYLRSCPAEAFGSLRLVMTGAEKLPERLAGAFEERFGIRPLEGYGCTECAPVVAVNCPDYRAAGLRQVGAKRGKIGHPLPGVCVRLVDPDSEAPVPVGQAGLLLVRGPNVMQGYLGLPDKTAEVLRNGWYVTGDIAALDEDGFLQITDRLSRFSKIAGEMVPHIKVEERLHELAGVTEQTFVVAGLPDPKKGERLVVLHRLPPAALAPCLEKLSACDLPNLWKPRPDQFFFVENFLYLGTGKLDLRQIRELAAKLAGADA